MWEEYEDDDKPPRVMDNMVDSTGRLLNQQLVYDKLLNVEVQMKVGYGIYKGLVTGRAIGPDGQLIGSYDKDPSKTKMVNEVEFQDGEVNEYSANIIAENMLNQVDQEPFFITIFKGILEYKKDKNAAMSKIDAFSVDKIGRRQRKKSTKGLKLLVEGQGDT
jgi:hypothetical protein